MTALHPLALRPLPLASIRPAGWLKRQLQIQRDGLSGHLHTFWPDIMDSAWFGGKAEGWERAPYWLDGAIPLAYLLEDESLKRDVDRYMDYVLTHRRADGWIGPARVREGDPEDAARYDMWAVLLTLKVLCVYHDASGDERALDAAEKAVEMLVRHTAAHPLFGWGHHRWFEGLIAVFYLYEKRGNPEVLTAARRLINQGFDWRAQVLSKEFEEPTPIRGDGWRQWRHVVNLAMAVKTYGLVSRITGSESDREFCREMMARLDAFHGQASGVFSGDECASGTSPLQGTELCAVVEYMYSLEILASVTGDGAVADRLEKITFNALPATFSPDMWGHQYDQQANQVLCSNNPDHRWSTNGPESNTFGLEPNYGCCTANLSQGWPKFAASLWMRTPEDGFAAVAYAPCRIRETKDGVGVRIDVDTEYPFRDTVTVRVATDAPVTFDLQLRIPEWCDEAGIEADWGTVEADTAAGGRAVIRREWSGTATIRLRLPMPTRVEDRHRGAATVTRGPLVYSLKIGEDWRRVNEEKPFRELPHGDWEVHPTTPWNYALDVDAGFRFSERPVGDTPFSPEGAPVVATATARRVPGWQLDRGWADEVPESPVVTGGEPETVELLPYGCTTLRITEFPRL